MHGRPSRAPRAAVATTQRRRLSPLRLTVAHATTQQAVTASWGSHTVLCARQTPPQRPSRAAPARRATGSPGARAPRAPRPAAHAATGASAPPAGGAGTWRATAAWPAPLRARPAPRRPTVWPVRTGTSRRCPLGAPRSACRATKRHSRGSRWQASTAVSCAGRRRDQALLSASAAGTEASR